MLFKRLGLQHPFFRPPARRILTVAVIALWAGLEIWAGNPGWALFALVVLGLTALEFFVLFDPKNYGDPDA